MQARGIFPEIQAETIINRLLQAQYSLSQQQIIHRDLKPQNIGVQFKNVDSDTLFDDLLAAEFLKTFDFAHNPDSYLIKFFDLGMSDKIDENGFGSTSKSGTPAFSSPEQLRGGF